MRSPISSGQAVMSHYSGYGCPVRTRGQKHRSRFDGGHPGQDILPVHRWREAADQHLVGVAVPGLGIDDISAKPAISWHSGALGRRKATHGILYTLLKLSSKSLSHFSPSVFSPNDTKSIVNRLSLRKPESVRSVLSVAFARSSATSSGESSSHSHTPVGQLLGRVLAIICEHLFQRCSHSCLEHLRIAAGHCI